jgi:hypothetical protein
VSKAVQFTAWDVWVIQALFEELLRLDVTEPSSARHSSNASGIKRSP